MISNCKENLMPDDGIREEHCLSSIEDDTSTKDQPYHHPLLLQHLCGESSEHYEERSSGRSLSLPGRPPSFISRAVSPTSPLIFQPVPDYFSKPDTAADRPAKRLTPWEAAARSPLGLVDEAFGPQSMQESIAANVVSAARRKTLPEPPEEWKQKVSYEPPAPSGSIALLGGKQSGIVSAPKSSLSAPSATTQAGSQLQYAYCSQRSRTDPDIMSMDSRSDYYLSTADSNYNPQPRGWRRPT